MNGLGIFRKRILVLFLFVFLSSSTRAALAMSDEQEISLGQQLAYEVEHRYGLWHDAQWEPLVAALGDELAQHASRKLPYTFKIINLQQANAFALPGGFIYVTRGLLPFIKNEDQMASILAHEISHVELRHIVKRIDRANTMNIIGIVAMILTRGAARGVLNIASLLNSLVFEPGYGRGQETEADLAGVGLMVKSGRDPNEMIAVFEEFQRKGHDGGIIPAWMRDHPLFADRIAGVRQEIKKYPEVPALTARSRLVEGEVAADTSESAKSAVQISRDSSGALRVRWVGESAGIQSIQYQARGENGEVLAEGAGSRDPFEAVLKPEKPVSRFLVILSYADGGSASLEVPVTLSSAPPPEPAPAPSR